MIEDKLSKDGFVYKNKKNEFSQNFPFGKRTISMSFISTLGLIQSVQFFYHSTFNDLEREFKKVLPNFKWTNWTINYNLHWTYVPLYDERTGKYSDKSLNKAAQSFFQELKPKIDELNNRFDNYDNLFIEYTNKPNEFVDFINCIEKRIINGLILVKAFSPESYESVKKEFISLLSMYNGPDKEESLQLIKEGIEYLDSNEVTLNKASNKY